MDSLVAERLRKSEKIRELGIDPFLATPFPKNFSATSAKELPTKNLEDIQTSPKQSVAVAGRLVLFRAMGKLAFGHLSDESGRIQICFQKGGFEVENLPEDVEFSPMKFVEKCVDLGDFLGVFGEMFETKHGEKTLFVKKLCFLSKALRPMPEKFHGLESRERCYRERNVDMMTNHETMSRFQKRSAMLREIREFFWEKGFLEVETPILQEKAGGAMARVFETHHNALDHDFVLRIALEIDHKRLLGGGFERIFEIGKCFRNEGSDPSHLQEFSLCEWYAAYESLETNQQWMEEMLRRICTNIFGKTKFNIVDKDDNEVEIDFEQKFHSVSFASLLEKYAGIDMFSLSDDDLRKKARELGIENAETAGRGNLLDDIYKKTARLHLIHPTFVLDWPSELKPLANPNGDGTSKVYQLLIAGWETINAYGELIDPTIQRKLLEDQQKAKNAGDDEAMEIDEIFLKAMEHGFPPMTGNGFGVDRLCALLTGMPNLRDVVLFPTMKPENE
ncbi:lysine--tRNA ligase [Candidatus Peregrinibacteria bacterium]|nr:MAG: lysine--tRNA ligase [Candidatus Peregrinibacteria bacterium]